MKVSVVIPAYNEEDYIGPCLESLKRQTVKPHEVIVVDNNSTDRTAEIARSLGAVVIHESRPGTIHARDTGFDAATGDIIARTDADTQCDPTWIESIQKCAQPTRWAATGPIYYDSPFMENDSTFFDIYMHLNKLSFGQNIWIGPNIMFSRDLWPLMRGKVSKQGKKVHEDIDLALVAGEFTCIKYEPTITVHSSSRRARNNPKSFFIEYQIRTLRQLIGHRVKRGKEASDEFKHDLETGIDQGKELTAAHREALRTRIRNTKQLTVDIKQRLQKLLKRNPTEAFRNLMEKIFMEMEKN